MQKRAKIVLGNKNKQPPYKHEVGVKVDGLGIGTYTTMFYRDGTPLALIYDGEIPCYSFGIGGQQTKLHLSYSLEIHRRGDFHPIPFFLNRN